VVIIYEEEFKSRCGSDILQSMGWMQKQDGPSPLSTGSNISRELAMKALIIDKGSDTYQRWGGETLPPSYSCLL
jgi:hypothetical protein